MKNPSKNEVYAISAIVVIFLLLGIRDGLEFLESLKPNSAKPNVIKARSQYKEKISEHWIFLDDIPFQVHHLLPHLWEELA